MTNAKLQRVLYVEDEPDIREVARFALEYSGRFQVRICASGDEALKVVPQFQPDLILMDVMMPGMDGLTTMDELRKNPTTAAIPIVFMTAKVQAAEVSRYLERGAISVIPKPFDPRTLGDLVQEIW
ncbi:MAG: response regulator [Alphaproteobacteria bacterium]|nr:response regulator [Alphaproteobacteria bacterium]